MNFVPVMARLSLESGSSMKKSLPAIMESDDRLGKRSHRLIASSALAKNGLVVSSLCGIAFATFPGISMSNPVASPPS